MPSYEAQLAKFEGLNTQVLGISVDHIPCLQAWQEHLGGISYPLCSDFWPHGAVAEKYGVLRPDGTSERAIFVIDREGIVRYIDIHDIDQQPDNEVLFNVLKKLNPGYIEQPEEEIPVGDVVVYCTSWCPDCKKAKHWLDEHQINYVEVDIEKVSKFAQKVRDWTGGDLITPVIETKGRIIIDYDQKQLEEIFLK